MLSPQEKPFAPAAPIAETANIVPPFLSVVVPHFDDFEKLALCLAALRRQSWPVDCFEVIVADNNSPGGVARAQAVAGEGITVVPAREQGAGLARNAAVAVARGDIFAFIDSDCFADPGWLQAGVAGLARFDYVGGRVITKLGAIDRITPAEAYEAVFAFNFKKYIEKDKFAGTGNLFVPRLVFERVGAFRAGVSEDMDWCQRANALGYRLGYVPDAVVAHAARREWSALQRKWNRVLAEQLMLARERASWRPRWIAYAIVVALSPLPHAFRVLRSSRLPGCRAKLMGLIGLVGIREYRAAQMLRFRLRGARRHEWL